MKGRELCLRVADPSDLDICVLLIGAELTLMSIKGVVRQGSVQLADGGADAGGSLSEHLPRSASYQPGGLG